MRWKYWNATFVAGCLSVAGLAPAQVALEPAPEAVEAEPLVLQEAPDVPPRPLPTPAPEAPRPLLIQPGAMPQPTPAALPPGVPAGPYYVAAGRAMAGAGAQPGASYRVQLFNARGGREPWIGVAVSPVPPALAHQLHLDEGSGVVVESVYPKTPAEKAGLQQYDIIERIDGKGFGGPEQFSAYIRSHNSGGKITLSIIREGEPTEVAVRLSRRPPSASDQPGAYPPGLPPWQSQTPYGNQAAPRPRFFTAPQPPGAMPTQPYGQPGAPAFPRASGQSFSPPVPMPPGGMTPGQPYPEMPANPGARMWGYAKTPPPGVMPGQPSPQMPAAPGDGGGARFWGPANPRPPGVMPGQPYYRAIPDSPSQGSSVRLEYENGQLTATVYSPDGKIMMKGPVEALMNQPGVPSDARRMLQRLRADRSSAKAIKPKKQKSRKDDDEDEDDDAQPRGR